MTKRQRVLNALAHNEGDLVPFHADFTGQELERILADKDGAAFLEQTGSHLHYIQYWGWPTEIPGKPDHFLDDFGVIWNRSGADKDIGVVNSPMINRPDISLWQEPQLDEARLRGEYETLKQTADDRFTLAAIGFSVFERLWSFCGMENALAYMLEEPEFVHELLDKICDYNIKIIKIASEYGFDGFYFGDDWGQQKGLIMGPALWREFIKPRIKRMYAAAKASGHKIFQHSCGDIESIFPDLIEIGLDCYQTFQPEIYDIAAIKAKYGASLSFWGGVSTQQLLPFATPEKVIEETVRIVRIMRQRGGYIAAPTHAVPADVPIENVYAMFEVFQNQQKYL